MSASKIDTAKVIGRRTLRFDSIDQIEAEVERLASAPTIRGLGNWSPGQVFKHIALTMDIAVVGAKPVMPAIMIAVLSWLFKRKFLTSPMKAGFQLPKKAVHLLPPDPTETQDGLRVLRESIAKFKNLKEYQPSPFLGRLTGEEWVQLQCRHAELHLSFLIPETAQSLHPAAPSFGARAE